MSGVGGAHGLRAGVVAIAIVGAAAGAAAAQTAVATRPAYSVERFTPAAGAGTWLGIEPADVLPAMRWAVTTSWSLVGRPIVLRDVQTGRLAREPVRLRWTTDVAVARGLGARYQLGVALPLAAQWGDRLQGIGLDERPLARFVPGDLRLSARARLVGPPGGRGLGAAVALGVTLPTGDDHHFAGEAGWTLSWGVRAGWRGERLELTGGAGLRVRTREVVLLSPARPHGNELTASAGVAVRLDPVGRTLGGPDRAWALLEVEAALGDSPTRGVRGPSPGEARAGVRLQVHRCWSVALAAGGGFTPDEVGAPAWRAVAQLSFDQAPPRDRDGDGIPDHRDACWAEPEDHDGWQDGDGCPDPDNDGDGIPDELDRCPLEPEDLDGHADADGCPDFEERLPGRPELVGPED
ncbi:MAG: thrombospondin type 3 repeat-containing protein [Kofleriaceae bacterium]|nr:thrombospondin type 3 repeat-containing protein [Kofleriaceae bacterium]MCL4224822.1 thrombospondin type 3 repeat-containing protein [Myxococcales bacterium]